MGSQRTSYQQSPVDDRQYWDKHSLTTWVNLESFNTKILPNIQNFLLAKAEQIFLSHVHVVGMTIVDTTVHASNLLAKFSNGTLKFVLLRVAPP